MKSFNEFVRDMENTILEYGQQTEDLYKRFAKALDQNRHGGGRLAGAGQRGRAQLSRPDLSGRGPAHPGLGPHRPGPGRTERRTGPVGPCRDL